MGSVGHEDILKLTDLKDVFEDEDDVEEDSSEDVGRENERPDIAVPPKPVEEGKQGVQDPDSDEPESGGEPKSKKRKKKRDRDPLTKKRDKKARNQILTDPSFFSGL